MVTKRQSLLLVLTVAVLAIFAVATTAFGATNYLGGATANDGVVTLTSQTKDANADNDYSAINFTVPDGTTFAELSSLSTRYNVTDDGCMGGSPRFQIKVDTGNGIKNIFSYLGPQPNYTDCPLNTWIDSGDLLTSGRSIDTSQVGGTFYDTYEHALSAYGSYEVVSVQLVADAGWAASDGEQTILIDSAEIDGTTYNFTSPAPEPTKPMSKDDCKKGGWQKFSNPSFKNQGQCVSSFNNNR